MKTITCTGLLVLCAALPFALAQEAALRIDNAWTFPDFSATQAVPMGAYDKTARIYRSGSTVRIAVAPVLDLLYVPAGGKIYKLTSYPDGSHQCVVMTPAQDKNTPVPLAMLFGVKVSKTESGSDVIEGHHCRVVKARVTRADGSVVDNTVWQADDLNGIPVKIVSKLSGSTFTAVYRDVKVGAPDRTLMEAPSKCTPYDKMWQLAK